MPAALPYDFRDPLPMPAGAARLVAAVTGAAPRVGLLLGLACGRTVPASCPGVRRVALVEVATPAAVWAPLSCGLPDPGLILVPADAAVALADLYLGGLGEGEARPCTPLEQQLLVRHTLPALRPLAEALADHGVTSFAAGPISDDPLPVGGGEVVAVPLDLALPTGSVVRLTLCLPAKSLLPSDPDPAPAVPSPATRSVLSDVEVDVALRLLPTVVSAEEVEDLQPGDVIRLDPEATDRLVGLLAGSAEDVPVLTAALGRRGRRRAVAVSAVVGAAQPGGL
ncbi:MAG: FliM/FliN family flagellar motor switch protein [Mycobacteriales bacterium]